MTVEHLDGSVGFGVATVEAMPKGGVAAVAAGVVLFWLCWAFVALSVAALLWLLFDV